jgi:hypothetical protein
MQLPSELVRIPTPEEMQAMAQVQKVKEENIRQFIKQILSDEEMLLKIAPKSKDLLTYLNLAMGGEADAME